MRFKNKTLVVNLMLTLLKVSEAQYTNEWAVDVDGGHEEAELVASETGCVNQGKTPFFQFCKLVLQRVNIKPFFTIKFRSQCFKP